MSFIEVTLAFVFSTGQYRKAIQNLVIGAVAGMRGKKGIGNDERYVVLMKSAALEAPLCFSSVFHSVFFRFVSFLKTNSGILYGIGQFGL
jgi:hypothetical protein